MPESLIREIAKQVVSEQMLSIWYFYAIFAIILLVCSTASSFFGAYLRRRGENFATKADMDNVLDEISKTTTLAEGIRTSIAHSDWAVRELKITRRGKLEQLLEATYAMDDWLGLLRNHCLANGPETKANPSSRVTMLGKLYFPELDAQVNMFSVSCSRYVLWLYERRAEILAAHPDFDAQMRIRREALPELQNHVPHILQAIANLEAECRQVMDGVLRVERPA